MQNLRKLVKRLMHLVNLKVLLLRCKNLLKTLTKELLV